MVSALFTENTSIFFFQFFGLYRSQNVEWNLSKSSTASILFLCFKRKKLKEVCFENFLLNAWEVKRIAVSFIQMKKKREREHKYKCLQKKASINSICKCSAERFSSLNIFSVSLKLLHPTAKTTFPRYFLATVLN